MRLRTGEGDGDLLTVYTVKNIRISQDILWRFFHILTEPVPYTSVFVHRRNNETRDHTASLFRRLTDTNECETGSVKM